MQCNHRLAVSDSSSALFCSVYLTLPSAYYSPSGNRLMLSLSLSLFPLHPLRHAHLHKMNRYYTTLHYIIRKVRGSEKALSAPQWERSVRLLIRYSHGAVTDGSLPGAHPFTALLSMPDSQTDRRAGQHHPITHKLALFIPASKQMCHGSREQA
jgi:hypothetical protein